MSVNTTRLLVGGQETQINQDGSFQAIVPVVLGRNGIEIIAQAEDGRISKRKLYGTYGVPPLAVQITAPSDGITVCNSSLDVVGVVNQTSAQVYVTWPNSAGIPGQYATINGNSFQTTINSFSGGAITAKATDPYGNYAYDQISYYIQQPVQHTPCYFRDPATDNPGRSICQSYLDYNICKLGNHQQRHRRCSFERISYRYSLTDHNIYSICGRAWRDGHIVNNCHRNNKPSDNKHQRSAFKYLCRIVCNYCLEFNECRKRYHR